MSLHRVLANWERKQGLPRVDRARDRRNRNKIAGWKDSILASPCRTIRFQTHSFEAGYASRCWWSTSFCRYLDSKQARVVRVTNKYQAFPWATTSWGVNWKLWRSKAFLAQSLHSISALKCVSWILYYHDYLLAPRLMNNNWRKYFPFDVLS